jgi:hypothetical protein
MLDRRSALVSAKPYISNQLTIAEAPYFVLIQFSGADKDLKKVLGRLPARIGIFQDDLMRVSTKQIWSLGDPVDAPNCFVTPLSSSRTRIEISGAPVRDVLAKCAAIDFHRNEFKPGTFVLTGIHHVPVLIHCDGADLFYIYVLRTFALNIWEWLCDAGLEYAA